MGSRVMENYAKELLGIDFHEITETDWFEYKASSKGSEKLKAKKKN